jgi:DNA (cytosine-5)-methyltransferase 1
MEAPLRVASLCAGIGAFDLGFERAGFEVRWQCEIDPSARDLLRAHFDAPCFEDVTTLDPDRTEDVDVICAGFPCQDLSMAGAREGLFGRRSGIFFDCARIIDAKRPRYVVLENVDGLLSSNGGRDMGIVLGVLGQLGYGFVYRVLDARYFGVPQQRRRVFVVGRLGGYCPPQILIESESVRRHPSPRRVEEQDVAATLTAGVRGRGGSINGRRREDDVNLAVVDVSPCLRAKGNAALRDDMEAYVPVSIGECVTGGVTHALTAEENDASEDGTGRGVPIVPVAALCVSTKTRNNQTQETLLPVAFQQNSRSEVRLIGVDGQVSGCLAAKPGVQQQNYILDENLGVRRLMPVECERLMGFPDNWTEGFSDTKRRYMLGNSIAVPVAEWVARRIARAEAGEFD